MPRFGFLEVASPSLPDLGSRRIYSGAEVGGTAATPAAKGEMVPFPNCVMHLAQFKHFIKKKPHPSVFKKGCTIYVLVQHTTESNV